MHRQSLGSPNSKLHTHHHVSSSSLISPKLNDAAAPPLEDVKRKDLSISPTNGATDDDKEEVNRKTQKLPEKFIHLIPLLIIFCFLILYLSSHDPSQKDSSNSNGFNAISKPLQ